VTAPAGRPDLLESVLTAFPGELALRSGTYGFTLVITAPEIGLRGFIRTRDRAGITAMAAAYERMRHDMRNAPARCSCGDTATLHDMASKKKPCSRYGCLCTGWQQAEGAE
jgi:hypothetical protein